MCRFLGIQADDPFDPAPWVRAFAVRCEESPEYQGHGWGVAWWDDGTWRRYRSLRPIWEDTFAPPSTDRVVVHARSAFRNEGIELDNNMPFLGDDLAFAFNGELHGVRLNVPGETGAARLFELLRRFAASGASTSSDDAGDAGDAEAAALEGAVRRLDELVARRSEHVRALNLLVARDRALVFGSRFTQEEDYFTMWAATREGGTMRWVASEPVDIAGVVPDWRPIPNETVGVLGVDGAIRVTGVVLDRTTGGVATEAKDATAGSGRSDVEASR